ncbi:MAG TPA: outer membrane lipoprotein-sorting protein [Enhygromyxa sp.]|nr:outer membrane lipoprotein-sorting protein [Enhygromyxa sp.]
MKMVSRRVLLCALLSSMVLVGPSLVVAAPPVDAPDPADPEFGAWLLDRVDDVHRGKSSHATLTMFVKTSRWERSMTMEAWTLGQDYSLVRILEPKKERGTATLKAKDDLFTYLSKTGRTVKISGASMGGSWMGSHYTNDDLMKDSRLAQDFDHVVKNGPTVAGEATWALVLTPKPKAVVVWGQVDVLVRKSDLLPVGQLFYDEDLNPVRKLEFFDYQQLGGEMVPQRLRMSPLDKPGEYTEVSYEKLDFNVTLDPEFFSVSQLKAL